MVGAVVYQCIIKILGDIDNDLMAIPGGVEGPTVGDRGTDTTGCADHKGMGTGNIIGGE